MVFATTEMNNEKGKVYLVGAGPGDPGLLTLKGAAKLALADVVLYDRLVAEETLQHAPATAIKLQVGKQRNCKAYTQEQINELLVQYAQQGKTVVRLKGGDVGFFANLLDELETLVMHAIPYEVVPGVTAASGCATGAGIPLTARHYSDEVHILSMHNAQTFAEKDWHYLAGLQGTLVLYMSSATLAQTAALLLQHGMDNRPLAVIEQGATPFQQTHIGTLAEAAQHWQERKFVSPALVIIGKVVLLAEKFGPSLKNEQGVFFKEVSKT